MVTPMFELAGAVDLSLEPTLEIGASITLDAVAGAAWREGQGWESWHDIGLSPAVVEPKIELGAGSLKLSLLPQMSFKIFGFLGPYIKADLYAKGSATVLIGKLPAARITDMTAHASCVAPIPSPTGKILPPGCPTVIIGG